MNPNNVELEWSEHNLLCQLKKGFSGAWCGYVRVPKRHPLDGVPYDEIYMDVHGGLTFGERDEEGYYWLGFDCAHCTDIMPDLPNDFAFEGATYKNKTFAKIECRKLAFQINAYDNQVTF